MGKGYAAKDAKPIPRLIFTVLFVLSLISIILLSSAVATHSAIPTPVIHPPIVETSLATVIVTAVPTRTATARPTETRGPLIPTVTTTPSFFGKETTGKVDDR